MYSYSRIQTYFNCPLQFKFRYVDRVKVEAFESIEAFLGKRVHEVLQKLYEDKKFQRTDRLSELIEYYENAWQKKYCEAIKIIKDGYTKENYYDMGRRYIEGYYNINFRNDASTTVSLEEKISLKLNGHNVIGYIDRLALNKDSVYEIHDYKTSGSMPHQSYLNKDEQLALYALAVKNMYSDAERIRLIWHYLAFNKSVVSMRTDDELEEVKNSIIKKINLIEEAKKENNFIPNASKLCSWCEYQGMCPIHAHRFEKEMVKDENVSCGKLVDEYAELKNRRAEIDEKIERVRNDIIDFSRRNRTGVLEGSACMAKVHESTVLRYPGAGEGKRKELEEFLKRSGLWDKVSALDAGALNRLMKETLIDKRICERIKSFGTEESSYRITIKKREE